RFLLYFETKKQVVFDTTNAKAGELGMKNTHFCNSTGLHEEAHYSTVQDISVLLRYALKNNDFLEIFESERHVTAPDSFHPDGLVFESTMFQYLDGPEVTGGRILGGKTGYTSQAGLCLASLADIDGQDYILVTAKADGTHQTQPFHILDAVNVYGQIGDSIAAGR
ncbi:MAG: D-alanyl-D-alanine carboxypeptidase, partial [Eubacteriales bacterium]|nr:D-alanyl-D-alanine carboxypeptidase [Eubacteriales bacterium]